MEKIKGGAFQVARQIFTSEIWIKKPSTWKVIWIYILGKVSHKDTRVYKTGEGFFNFSRELNQIGSDITYNMIREAMRYLKTHKMINTTKTTRGVIISVCNYADYQCFDNYRNKTENTSTNKTETKQKQNGNTTINKNDKKEKNDKNIYNNFKNFISDKEKILLEARNKYTDKDCNKAIDDFIEYCNYQKVSYKNYKLAFFKWVRDDRFNKYIKSINKRNPLLYA